MHYLRQNSYCHGVSALRCTLHNKTAWRFCFHCNESVCCSSWLVGHPYRNLWFKLIFITLNFVYHQIFTHNVCMQRSMNKLNFSKSCFLYDLIQYYLTFKFFIQIHHYLTFWSIAMSANVCISLLVPESQKLKLLSFFILCYFYKIKNQKLITSFLSWGCNYLGLILVIGIMVVHRRQRFLVA